MKFLTLANTVFDRILSITIVLASVLLVFVLITVSADVFFRYFLRRPLAWVNEVTTYIMLYIVFLGAAWLLKRNGHVFVDVVISRLKPGDAALLNIITSALGAIICLVITWFGVDVTWYNYREGIPSIQFLRTPLFLIAGIIPVGSFLLFIQFVRRTHGFVKGRKAS